MLSKADKAGCIHPTCTGMMKGEVGAVRGQHAVFSTRIRKSISCAGEASCSRNRSFRSLLSPMSWNMRWSLVVYSKPHASLRLEIMADSESGLADMSFTRRLASILE
jgi:hypothetical protein